jgi:hypothetical protein
VALSSRSSRKRSAEKPWSEPRHDPRWRRPRRTSPELARRHGDGAPRSRRPARRPARCAGDRRRPLGAAPHRTGGGGRSPEVSERRPNAAEARRGHAGDATGRRRAPAQFVRVRPRRPAVGSADQARLRHRHAARAPDPHGRPAVPAAASGGRVHRAPRGRGHSRQDGAPGVASRRGPRGRGRGDHDAHGSRLRGSGIADRPPSRRRLRVLQALAARLLRGAHRPAHGAGMRAAPHRRARRSRDGRGGAGARGQPGGVDGGPRPGAHAAEAPRPTGLPGQQRHRRRASRGRPRRAHHHPLRADRSPSERAPRPTGAEHRRPRPLRAVLPPRCPIDHVCMRAISAASVAAAVDEARAA